MPLQNVSKKACRFWHPPVCQNYKSETGCINGRKCFFRHVEAEEKPSNKSKKGDAKGSVALLKSETIWRVAPNTNSGKKGSIARNYSKV